MTWVTRARPMVDRVACPWLIKRFVHDALCAVCQKRVGGTP